MSFPPELDPVQKVPSSQRDDSDLNEKWKFRFSFFDQYGVPDTTSSATPEFKAAFMALPFRQRLLIGYNFFAFFFSFIYLATLGLWRKALVVAGIFVGLAIFGYILNFSDTIYEFATLAVCIMVAMRTNSYYYRKRVLGEESWSIF